MRENLQHVFIGNLSKEVTEPDIADLFLDYKGKYDNISIKNGYAFIYFYEKRDAESAMDRMNKRRLFGRAINLEFGDRMGGGKSRNEGRQTFGDRDGRDNYGRDSRGGGSHSYNSNNGGRGGNEERYYPNNRPAQRDYGRDAGPEKKKVFRTKYSIIMRDLDDRVRWTDLADFCRDVCRVRMTYGDANKVHPGEGIMTFECVSDMKEVYKHVKDQKPRFSFGKTVDAAYEFPEVLDPSWRGDAYNDRPHLNRTRSYNRGPSPRRDDRRQSPRGDDRRPSPRRDDRRPSPRRDDRRPSPRKEDRRPSPRRDDRYEDRRDDRRDDRKDDRHDDRRRSRSPARQRSRTRSPQRKVTVNRRSRSRSPQPLRRDSPRRRSRSPPRRSRSRSRSCDLRMDDSPKREAEPEGSENDDF